MLAISHPVVSKTISDLEQTVGCASVRPHVQGVELTTYGQDAAQVRRASVFDEMRQGLKQIEFLTDPNSGELADRLPGNVRGRTSSSDPRALSGDAPSPHPRSWSFMLTPPCSNSRSCVRATLSS